MQQRCPNCGSLVVPGQKFCGGCGAQLSLACPQCRITVSPGTRFCPNCGATLGGGMPQQSGWGQQPGGMPPQQPGRVQQPGGMPPQQPGWGQQAGGMPPQQPGGPQQPGWGQQPAWAPPARQNQPSSSNRPLLLGLLIFLLIGLGTLTYLYTPIGDTVKDLLQSATGGTGTTVITGRLEITEVKVQNITPVRADIRWSTNKPASTQAEYWVTSDNVETTELTDVPIPGEFLGVVDHVVKLTGLEPDTKYYYKVKSKDATGTEVVKEGDFNTPAMPKE